MNKESPRPDQGGRPDVQERTLMLINDEVNTFDHVITSLVEVCGHDEIQAEQCAVITHHKGGCVIKVADPDTLERLSLKLRELNLESVVI